VSDVGDGGECVNKDKKQRNIFVHAAPLSAVTVSTARDGRVAYDLGCGDCVEPSVAN